jgi:hypothetical protein
MGTYTDKDLLDLLEQHKHSEVGSDELREAILRTYAALARRDPDHRFPEHEQREQALRSINNILQDRPLRTGGAGRGGAARWPRPARRDGTHLDLLELLFVYWRETEVADEAEIKAPEPDPGAVGLGRDPGQIAGEQ